MTTMSEPQERRSKEVHREWSVEGLPKDLQHESIAFYRDVGLYRGIYQIGFAQSWMPYDYHPEYPHEITHARVEKHHPPHRSWWMRLLAPERDYLVIVVEEPDLPSIK